MDLDTFKSDARIEKIRIAVSERLSPKKYNHSINVAQYAERIAAKTSVDPKKMYIAGLLHDIASGLSNDKILQLCERTGRYFPSIEIRHARSLHGIAGACIAYVEFGIRDREILTAIAFHSGRAGMKQAEKIVFLADMIDHSCQNGYDPARIWMQTDLDSAILAASVDMIQHCVKHNLPMDKRTQDSFDYIIEHLQQNSHSGDPSYKTLQAETDEIVDKTMEIYRSHRLKIDSIKNIRDVGNFRTVSGKMIKKNRIIRSADLSRMTPKDAEQLNDLGINTIIDLRAEDEIADAKDQNIEYFRYFNVPLPKFESNDSSKRLLEFIKSSVSEEERAWYIAEYIRNISMQQYYHDVLMSDASVEQLRKVFDILLDTDTKGVLIHCSNGKDRTGIVVMLIQFALGMNEEEILNDYYASVVPYYIITESTVLMLEQNGYSGETARKTREVLGFSANVISDLNRWLKGNRYDTPEQYLREKIRISQERLKLFRRIYLES